TRTWKSASGHGQELRMRCFSTRPPEGQAHSGDWWRHGTRPLDEPPLPRARRERCDLWPPRGRAGADGRGNGQGDRGWGRDGQGGRATAGRGGSDDGRTRDGG